MRSPAPASRAELEESMGEDPSAAFRDPSFTLIFLGFFSCGYQLGFITAHFPAFVTEMCGPIVPGGMLHNIGITTTSALGAMAIAADRARQYRRHALCGLARQAAAKKYLLAAIYTGRTLAAASFILLPITPTTVSSSRLVMGALWLATVPLTSGLVAHIYGLRYMGTLYGIVFFSHQLGSFLGVWLGGRMYDVYGDYTAGLVGRRRRRRVQRDRASAGARGAARHPSRPRHRLIRARGSPPRPPLHGSRPAHGPPLAPSPDRRRG
jgi:hypothetical protein